MLPFTATWGALFVAVSLAEPAGVVTCGTEGRRCSIADNCDDGDPCNGAETCASLLCQCAATLPCDDGNVCTVDTCTVTPRGITCDHVARDCNDGVFCNGLEYCLLQFGCVHPILPPCLTSWCDEAHDRCAECLLDSHCVSDAQCTPDTCDVEAGVCAQPPDGTPCDDGDPCSYPDECVQGGCVAGFHNLANWRRLADCLAGPAVNASVECRLCFDLYPDLLVDLRDAAVYMAGFGSE